MAHMAICGDFGNMPVTFLFWDFTPTCHCAICVRTLQTMVLFRFVMLILLVLTNVMHVIYFGLISPMFITIHGSFRAVVSSPRVRTPKGAQSQSEGSENTLKLCKIAFNFFYRK